LLQACYFLLPDVVICPLQCRYHARSENYFQLIEITIIVYYSRFYSFMQLY